jgi:hypothetical protein
VFVEDLDDFLVAHLAEVVVSEADHLEVQWLLRADDRAGFRAHSSAVPGGVCQNERPCLAFGGDGGCGYPRRMRWRSRVKPARACIWRAIRLVLVLTPGEGRCCTER